MQQTYTLHFLRRQKSLLNKNKPSRYLWIFKQFKTFVFCPFLAVTSHIEKRFGRGKPVLQGEKPVFQDTEVSHTLQSHRHQY